VSVGVSAAFRLPSEWRPFAHVAIDHQPLTALEQWDVYNEILSLKP